MDIKFAGTLMERIVIILLCLLWLPVHMDGQTPTTSSSRFQHGFIENKGQIVDQNHDPNPEVLFLLHTPGMNVQLRRTGWSYDLYSPSPSPSPIGEGSKGWGFHRIDFDLVGCNPNCKIITSEPSADYVNYYTAGTPEEGVTVVRSYQTVTYQNVYPGVDMQCNAPGDVPFKYNFILAPGADPGLIRIRISGPDQVHATRTGIRCKTAVAVLDEDIPSCYYQVNGTQLPCRATFFKLQKSTWGIRIKQTIPFEATLVIDPVPTRRWGTYYGGASQEYGGISSVCSVDNIGNVYLAGSTSSTTNIATSGAFQTTLAGTQDGFLVKFSPDGVRLWATYYGGNYGANFYTCTVDREGNIIAGGSTVSTENIATPGAHQAVRHGSGDGFLVKFNPAGVRLWGSYYGGNDLITNGWEGCYSSATDTLGCIYIAGGTSSPDYIATPGAAQSTIGGNYDVFLVKFTPAGQREWGTYYGGVNMESQYVQCSVSKNGFVYLAGTTRSPDHIATPGSFLPVFSGEHKGFLACFNLAGQRSWGTYFGGEGNDLAYGCVSDTGSCIYLYGHAGSQTNIATPGVFQPVSIIFGGPYLEKFSETGVRLWGTYYGGDYADHVLMAAVNDSGYVYIAGTTMTQSSYLVSAGSFQPVFQGSQDIFLAKLDGEGQRVWGTYYGGTAAEVVPSCAIDHEDHVYLSGITYSGNQSSSVTDPCRRDPFANLIAAPGSHQVDLAGQSDAFLVKFANCQSPDTASQIYGPDTICANSQGISFSIDPIPSATGYHWCVSGNVTIVTGQNTPDLTVDIGPVTGPDTISVYGRNTCADGFPQSMDILVLPRPVVGIDGSDTICTGDTAVFLTDPGMNNYLWIVSPGGSIVTGGSGSDTLIAVIWSNGGTQWVSVTYEASGCPSLQPAVKTVWVNDGPAVEVTISASANPVCPGSPVTFTAVPVNPGNAPVYQWKVNGINAGPNHPLFTYLPENGDAVQCILNSNQTCVSGNPAVSNPVTLTVEAYLVVGVSITPSADPVCDGTLVSYSATPFNGGANPVYQWKVNANNAGINNAVFTYIPENGDVVTCMMTSSEPCTSGNPASGNPVSVIVLPAPAVTFTPCFDTITTTNAKPFRLKGGIPLGGTYSGPGVDPISGYFNPATAGAGSHQITYSYTNSALCEATSSLSIINYPLSIINCGDSLTDIRDNQKYPTILIGSRCWLAANLNYGTDIPHTTPQRDNCIPEKYLQPPPGLPQPGEGSVYQWDELMCYSDSEEIQGLCPPGWHVPSEANWNELFAWYQGNAFAGAPLKYTGYSGFNALLSGAGFFTSDWFFPDFATFFWSSTSHGSWKAWAHGLNDYNYSVSYYPSYRANAFGVRCVRD